MKKPKFRTIKTPVGTTISLLIEKNKYHHKSCSRAEGKDYSKQAKGFRVWQQTERQAGA